ncbi:Metallo-dependent phosphatase [Marasmius fiardii PR-910]|nr:Metallo-dependent phosphatase [Marasmius fiardii PR-910]
MSAVYYFAAFISSLFRIISYLFLRVIPVRLGPIALPVLYLLSFTSALIPLKSIKKEDEKLRDGVTSDNPSPISEVVFSLPSSSTKIRWINFIINTLLALAATDLIVAPYVDKSLDVTFSRVGAVYPDSVKIVTRYPNASHPVHVSWRESSVPSQAETDSKPWKQGPAFKFTEESDWTDTLTLKGLWPNTRYEYILTDNETNPLEYPSFPVSFRTFPDPRLPGGQRLRFVSSSCVTPNFPYVPMQWRTIKGFDLLADYLFPPSPLSHETHAASANSSTETDFMLFLGDFIYADVPSYTGNDIESYRRLYRRNYHSPSFRKVYEKLPILFTYDDHEIINNFDGNNNDSKPPFYNASSAFRTYNANSNYDSPIDNAYYYDFRYGDIAFFVMDTRRYRSEKSEDPELRTMLGETQLSLLHDWLVRVNNTATFKFIVSSVPLTSLWTHDAQLDSWAAYPSEKQSLLTTLHSIPNIVIISGDRHEHAAVEFNGDGPHKVMEFSTSPLSMFYIPLIRTLQPASNATITKEFMTVKEDSEGKSITVPETREISRERVINYVAEGNHKWATFEVDTRNRKKPTLRVELVVNGKPSYQYELNGTPVQLQSSSTALGAFVPSGVKDLFNRLGMRPGRWF